VAAVLFCRTTFAPLTSRGRLGGQPPASRIQHPTLSTQDPAPSAQLLLPQSVMHSPVPPFRGPREHHGHPHSHTIPSTVASAAITLAVIAPTLGNPHSASPGCGSAPCPCLRCASYRHMSDRWWISTSPQASRTGVPLGKCGEYRSVPPSPAFPANNVLRDHPALQSIAPLHTTPRILTTTYSPVAADTLGPMVHRKIYGKRRVTARLPWCRGMICTRGGVASAGAVRAGCTLHTNVEGYA
jgi:hypothetical protein